MQERRKSIKPASPSRLPTGKNLPFFLKMDKFADLGNAPDKHLTKRGKLSAIIYNSGSNPEFQNLIQASQNAPIRPSQASSPRRSSTIEAYLISNESLPPPRVISNSLLKINASKSLKEQNVTTKQGWHVDTNSNWETVFNQ